MIGHALQRAEDVAIVDAEYCCPTHHSHVGQGLQFGGCLTSPLGATDAVDLATIAVQSAAEQEIFIAENHSSAGSSRGQRGGQSGCATTDDQHIAEGMGFLIGIWIVLLTRATQARGAADQRLVDFFPERRRPHEGLVVKAGDENGRQQRID
jgi:hypothetical protein